ncbi:hypothetical protein PR202_ga25759 [Eleusine coracana subsp. coracana]|uniref:[RNA-polymerase]-subunit kinase n=1 Tax=Eleusine coracana subsp. coracana TaxID=191504 RepID=A0AAV5DA41_ELECO|nr:hypothetical protein PR202_ga25759 [Eleusine coracana subsp. coracana]
MGCVHGRPSASSPDRPPPPPDPAPAAAAAVQEPAGKSEQPAAGAEKPAVAAEKPARKERRSRSSRPASGPGSGSFANRARGEQVAAGWPAWLSAVAGEAIDGWTPRRADSFEKIDKIGQGTYSNVYKARDTVSGKIVALKKVRFDNLEPESVRFMAREILILRRLDHPNVIKLEGLVTSRMSCSLYLVFEYMEHDLAGLAASPDIKFTEPQVKCYMHQLLSGLEHCHDRGVLHRDIKGSNLLLDNNGMLKIADFGLASFFDPDRKQPMTSRVVTLWYRPPELLLGATDYGVGVDLWSAGLRAAGGRSNVDGPKKTRTRDRPKAVPAPEANAELQDGAVGVPLDSSNHMDPLYEPPDPSSFSTVFAYEKGAVPTWSGPLVDPSAVANQKRKHKSGRLSKQPATARAR